MDIITDLSGPPLFIALGVGGALVGLILVLIISWLRRGRRTRPERLQDLAEDSAIFSVSEDIRISRPSGASERFDNAFERFIYRTQLDISAEEALATMFLSGALFATLAFFWRDDIAFTFLGLCVGLLIPLAAFWVLSGRYRRKLQSQIPDAFFLLARSLRAGLSFPQALKVVEEQGLKPIASEFAEINGTIELGLPVSEAIERVSKRLDLLDFKAFVSAVAMYQRTGGNLALILDRLASGTRDRNQFRRQFFAATAQGRAVAIILGAAVPVLLLLYLFAQPERLEAFVQSSFGLGLIGVAIGLQIIGCFWIYQILRIDY